MNPGVKKEDYAFTVEALGTPWDVYRFTKDGAHGMMAFRKVGETWEIGMFRKGEFSPEEVVRLLTDEES